MSWITKEEPTEDKVTKERSDTARNAKSSEGFSGPRGPMRQMLFGFLCKFGRDAHYSKEYSRYLG